MIKLVVLILSVSLASGLCFAQSNSGKQLDIEKFTQNSKFNKWEYEKADSIYVITKDAEYYTEIATLKGTTLQTVYLYYNDGQLRSEGCLYHNVPIGIHSLYNEKGEPAEEINVENDFGFSMDDVRKFILDKYDVDIRDSVHIKRPRPKVNRTLCFPDYEYKGRFVYYIDWPGNNLNEHIILDGKDGTVLSHKIPNGKLEGNGLIAMPLFDEMVVDGVYLLENRKLRFDHFDNLKIERSNLFLEPVKQK